MPRAHIQTYAVAGEIACSLELLCTQAGLTVRRHTGVDQHQPGGYNSYTVTNTTLCEEVELGVLEFSSQADFCGGQLMEMWAYPYVPLRWWWHIRDNRRRRACLLETLKLFDCSLGSKGGAVYADESNVPGWKSKWPPPPSERIDTPR